MAGENGCDAGRGRKSRSGKRLGKRGVAQVAEERFWEGTSLVRGGADGWPIRGSAVVRAKRPAGTQRTQAGRGRVEAGALRNQGHVTERIAKTRKDESAKRKRPKHTFPGLRPPLSTVHDPAPCLATRQHRHFRRSRKPERAKGRKTRQRTWREKATSPASDIEAGRRSILPRPDETTCRIRATSTTRRSCVSRHSVRATAAGCRTSVAREVD
jgi:hypothetical protein